MPPDTTPATHARLQSDHLGKKATSITKLMSESTTTLAATRLAGPSPRSPDLSLIGKSEWKCCFKFVFLSVYIYNMHFCGVGHGQSNNHLVPREDRHQLVLNQASIYMYIYSIYHGVQQHSMIEWEADKDGSGFQCSRDHVVLPRHYISLMLSVVCYLRPLSKLFRLTLLVNIKWRITVMDVGRVHPVAGTILPSLVTNLWWTLVMENFKFRWENDFGKWR